MRPKIAELVRKETERLWPKKEDKVIGPFVRSAFELGAEFRDGLEGWVKVEDGLPEIIPNSNGGCSRLCLVHIPTDERKEHGETVIIAYWCADGWVYHHGDLMQAVDSDNLRSWRYLPSPPTEK